MTTITTPTTTATIPAFPLAGAMLDALSRRDFDAIAECLDPDVHLRALLPPRDVDVIGRADTLAEFRRWFGNDAEELELVDASVAEVGTRVHARWVVRMTAASGARVVEQHAYVDAAGPRITSMRLLCSGFMAEGPA